ncbi:transporter substrate-binding domain-containing protein [Pseudaeromonas sharmana]|uniref:Transporter substrate-binding domain-containing protein n=1 Tax=Pseudaeromonas sharmana TaxID=328412 RepID=A0ABV8CKV9_9GAMM
MKLFHAAALAMSLFSVQALATEVKFATEATYPPFEYMTDKNEFAGFDIELAQAVCAAAKLTCTFSNQAFDSLIPSLKFRRFDVAIAAMDVTEERAKQVDFSDIYYANSAVFVAAESKFTTSEQLAGKSIGVQNGTSHQSYLLEQLKDKDVKAVPYASYQNALMDLTSGRVDAVFADTAVAAEWLKSHPGYQMVGKPVTDAKYFGAGFAMAVNKGNKALLDSLNQGLAAIKADGSYQKLYDKYFAK